MLYLVVSNGSISFASVDHTEAEKAYADAEKAANDQTDVRLIQFQADEMAVHARKLPPKAIDVSKLTPAQVSTLQQAIAQLLAAQQPSPPAK